MFVDQERLHIAIQKSGRLADYSRDLLRDSHPNNSLQLAFYTLAPFYVLAAALFLVLSRKLKHEASAIGDKR